MNLDIAADTVRLLPQFVRGHLGKEEFPKDWTLGTIVGIPKKGNLADQWNDWKGVTLLSIPSRVFCKVIIMRIENVVDTTLRKEHWVGFRRGPERNNWAYIHSRDHDSLYGALILEQSNEWQRNIYINFVDFEKEFDSVHGRNLWKVLRHYGIPAKVTKIISQF